MTAPWLSKNECPCTEVKLLGLEITFVTVSTVPSDCVEAAMLVIKGGAVKVTLPLTVSEIETGAEKVDSGVTVTV